MNIISTWKGESDEIFSTKHYKNLQAGDATHEELSRRYRQKPWSKRFRKKFVCELIKSVRVLPSRETKKDFQFCPKEVHHRKNLTKCSISFWNSNNIENTHTFSVIDKLRASIYDSQTKIMRSNLYARAEPQGCNETIETERERHTGKRNVNSSHNQVNRFLVLKFPSSSSIHQPPTIASMFSLLSFRLTCSQLSKWLFSIWCNFIWDKNEMCWIFSYFFILSLFLLLKFFAFFSLHSIPIICLFYDIDEREKKL